MSARAALSALILSTLVSIGLSCPVHAGPWLPAPGEYYTELRGGLFSADSYHNLDGDRVSFPGKWEQRSVLSYTEMGWKKKISFVLAAPLVSSTVRVDDAVLTRTALGDLLVGFRYRLRQGPSALALEFDWSTPLGYSRQTPLIGDGLQQLSLSALYGTALGKRGFLQAGAGYGYRFFSITRKKHDFKDAAGVSLDPQPLTESADRWGMPFTASADLGFWVTRTLLVGGRYSGTMTTSHGDLYPWEGGDWLPHADIHLAGPVLVYRVDDRLDLVAGSWSTAMAKNWVHFDQAYVALVFKQTKLNRLQGFLGSAKNP